MTEPVMAYGAWKNNGEMITDVARLGYLDGKVLDCTYGYGKFWTEWRPERFVGCDIDVSKSPVGYSVDFTAMPWTTRSFKAVVFDPPYKLNGTPEPVVGGVDERYGVHEVTRWQDRMDLMWRGLVECCRVGREHVLMKCQDQVCSGRVRWQTVEFTLAARELGWGLVDRFDMASYRPQPPATRQVHARRNVSTLLVFRRGWKTT